MIINESTINNITNNHHLDEIYKNSLFFDIETTGLSRQYSDLISITILLYEECEYKIYQIFCQYKIDQAEAIKHLKYLMKSKKYVITYNGNTFDIPFLLEKAKQSNIDLDFDSMIKVDLYNYMQKLKNKVCTENLKLKTIEKFFNINRNDTLIGKDIITLYEAYKLEPRKEFSYLILSHNYEDVYNLPFVMNNIFNLFDDIVYFKNFIIIINNNDILIKRNKIISKFNIIASVHKDYIKHSMNYNIKILDSKFLEIEIPLNLYKDKNLEEFYYLDNYEYKIKSYIAIKGIKKNLIPIKLNEKIYYENIRNILKNIINEDLVDILEIQTEELKGAHP